MRSLIKVISLLMLLLSFPLFAQEPVVGVDDPESLFVDDDPVMHRNKQATLHIMRELLQCGQWDRAGEWLTDDYIQHNPNAASGLEGVIFFFTQVLGVQPNEDCDELTTEITAIMADGDYVTMLRPQTYDHPNKPGETYTTSWYDTWRFVDGKADEHWDPATITPAP